MYKYNLSSGANEQLSIQKFTGNFSENFYIFKLHLCYYSFTIQTIRIQLFTLFDLNFFNKQNFFHSIFFGSNNKNIKIQKTYESKKRVIPVTDYKG